MRIILEGDRRIRLLVNGAGLEIESADPAVQFSPLHMLAGSLATCTLSVLASWAQAARLSFDDLEIELAWDYVPDPYRVGSYEMLIRWPSLPEERRAAALRAARHCTVEHTLTHPPTIQIDVTTG